MLVSDGQRARAWVAQADGHPGDARSLLLATADECADHGLVALEALALHDLLRLGGPPAIAECLAAGVAGAQGAWLPALAVDGAAIASGRADELSASVEVLEAMGTNLLAAESASRASAAFARAGRQRDATSWSHRCEALVALCEGASTPALVRADGAVPLTAREREIALLASTGLKSKDIAERLFLSSRTVDNNLARVYPKLGVSDRSALAGALDLV